MHLFKPFSWWYHKIGLSKQTIKTTRNAVTAPWLVDFQATYPSWFQQGSPGAIEQTGLHWVTGLPKSIKKPCRRMSFSLELVARLAQSSWYYVIWHRHRLTLTYVVYWKSGTCRSLPTYIASHWWCSTCSLHQKRFLEPSSEENGNAPLEVKASV